MEKSNYCIKTFSHYSNRNRHEKTCQNNPEGTCKSIQCNHCEAKFNHKSDHDRHEKNHCKLNPLKESASFQCDYCELKFYQKIDLNRHACRNNPDVVSMLNIKDRTKQKDQSIKNKGWYQIILE
jgi:hypothetical protein